MTLNQLAITFGKYIAGYRPESEMWSAEDQAAFDFAMGSGATHDLYTDNDADRPDVICDSNGQVVLGLCKKCGKGEAELDGPCEPHKPSSGDQRRVTVRVARMGALSKALGHPSPVYAAIGETENDALIEMATERLIVATGKPEPSGERAELSDTQIAEFLPSVKHAPNGVRYEVYCFEDVCAAVRKAAALLAADKAGGEVVGVEYQIRHKFCPNWTACDKATHDHNQDGETGAEVREVFRYTHPQPQAEALPAERVPQYHCIGFIDGYGTEIKDKSAKMKAPRAVYVVANGDGKDQAAFDFAVHGGPGCDHCLGGKVDGGGTAHDCQHPHCVTYERLDAMKDQRVAPEPSGERAELSDSAIDEIAEQHASGQDELDRYVVTTEELRGIITEAAALLAADKAIGEPKQQDLDPNARAWIVEIFGKAERVVTEDLNMAKYWAASIDCLGIVNLYAGRVQ